MLAVQWFARVSRGWAVAVVFLVCSASAAQLTLRWDDNSTNESGFRIERATGTGSFSQIATVGANATSYIDSAVTAGTTYRYRVRSYNGAGNSTYSNIVSIVAQATATATETLNSAPIISSISNRTVASDGTKYSIPFTISDSITAASSLKVVASSSNPAVIPQSGVVVGGSGGSRAVTLSPVLGISGKSTITVAVHDGELVSYRTFTVTVNGTKAASISTPVTGRLSRITAHALAGPAADTLLVEFTVAGASKSILARAVGPTLSTLGISGGLADPRLGIMRSTAVVGLNDDWGGLSTLLATFTRVGAFSLPLLSRDAALQETLSTGIYSMVVSGPLGAKPGQVLAELYDADTSSQPTGRLRHTAAQTQIKGTSRTVVLGFVISGTNSLRVLIRGVGNSLSLPKDSVVKRPRLEVYRGTSLLHRADGWTPTASMLEAVSRAGAKNLSHLADGAVLVTLSPGAYTAVLSGIDGSAGSGQVELYEVR